MVGNRRRLVVLLSLYIGTNWVGNGIISYYLTPVLRSIGVTSPGQIILLTAGLAIWNLVIAFGAAINVERFGRRPLFFISIIGMLISYRFVTGLLAGFSTTKKSGLSIAVIPFLFLYYGFYDIAWTPLPVSYTAEILPFNLRTKGLAIFVSVGTATNAFNQFMNPVALQAMGWKYIHLHPCVLSRLFVHSIEEVSVIFDKRNGHIEKLNDLAMHAVEIHGNREEMAFEPKENISHVEKV
ncbi:uncharacterized protein TrAFT101_006422 [Trichoderma asperellum]|uniref:uncharacterized protein n=1 Tax=Trichoderma asperellum TaxID=101201 RepID=UPI00332E9D70|nr:hypothetical protein TrAFT101_006422 [Trichoderma asperellum]